MTLCSLLSSYDCRYACKQRGSMVLEIIVALAVFSIICLPILIFVFSEEGLHSKSDRAHASAYQAMKEENFHWLDPSNTNGYSNRHACDSALARYVAASDHAPPEVSHPGFFHHERNLITAIRAVHHAGNSYLIIGTNSASTTDPDIYAFVSEHGKSIGEYALMRSMDTGPGIVDLDVEGGHLYAVERSVVGPLWRIPLNRLLDDQSSNPEDDEADEERIPLLLQDALPTRILAAKDGIFLGLDKNPGTELRFLARIAHLNGEAFVLSDGKEIDAGVNDISMTPDELLIASPNNVEVFGFEFERGSDPAMGLTGLGAARPIDLPGSSGNGKALAAYKRDLYIGRTVGNVEFHKLHGPPDDRSTAATLDINRSIVQIEEIFGGSHMAVLAKTPQPALLLYEKRRAESQLSSELYILKETIGLPGIATAMTCSATDFIIATESIEMPITRIRF